MPDHLFYNFSYPKLGVLLLLLLLLRLLLLLLLFILHSANGHSSTNHHKWSHHRDDHTICTSDHITEMITLKTIRNQAITTSRACWPPWAWTTTLCDRLSDVITCVTWSLGLIVWSSQWRDHLLRLCDRLLLPLLLRLLLRLRLRLIDKVLHSANGHSSTNQHKWSHHRDDHTTSDHITEMITLKTIRSHLGGLSCCCPGCGVCVPMARTGALCPH